MHHNSPIRLQQLNNGIPIRNHTQYHYLLIGPLNRIKAKNCHFNTNENGVETHSHISE